MKKVIPEYIDHRNGLNYQIDELRWCSEKKAPLMMTALPGMTRDEIDSRHRSLWRYQAALPVIIKNPVSLGEGCTPLVGKRWNNADVLFKLEWFNPTSSFKDRGAAVMVSYLAQLGVKELIEDSSGNGGAAIAASCAAAGIKARILAPESTSPAKLLQSRAFGAEVQLVPGSRQDTENEALRQSESTFYASHNWHPFFLQGTKSLAYELWEDLGFKAPDNIIIPTGAGSNVLGCDIGFSELLAAGQINKLPKLLIAQPANCAPIDATFQAGATELVPTKYAATIAEGTAIRSPVRLKELLDAIRRSGGNTAAITEEQITQAVIKLTSMGLYAEPTSATAAAAIDEFMRRGVIKPGETTVVILTGSGLKASGGMSEIFAG
ncbi:threonine synthase [Budviciaceae bacterium BWR-B9]|uniref:Threonine synthase n=1 Tax=Limnobaculum allomyrinae TaxID=2791986 RepID=A0ABS1ISD9_9GAMM|nr:MULTISPECIES: threonine synthase [Limnobaculum]MBK5144205.1 threonine synthase [Limnobaculum allomyrinae]MBV7692051.1 threonine synthase [Limnobaculum sp. M2-1]